MASHAVNTTRRNQVLEAIQAAGLDPADFFWTEEESEATAVGLGREPFTVNRGDRIAQMIFARIEAPELTHVLELDPTGRGEGGFGSTGRGACGGMQRGRRAGEAQQWVVGSVEHE